MPEELGVGTEARETELTAGTVAVAPTRAIYQIDHDTRYVYDVPVSTSQHMACLKPRALACQRLRSHALRIEPAPVHVDERLDFFGNIVHHFQLLRPHVELAVRSTCLVELTRRTGALDIDGSPAWESVRAAIARPAGDMARDVAAFAYASPHAIRAPEITRYARASFPAGRPLLAGAVDLMHRIHEEFAFDTTATSITTPVTRVLLERRGVCQDFAHFQIACLRALGLAARYVSGYLLTDPPPGQPRLIGADASHAWLSVYCPANGWVDVDPTNDVTTDLRHVTIAWGRDYGDVSPLRGVLLGGAGHRLLVGVSVVPQG